MVSVNAVLLTVRPLAADWQEFADQATVFGVIVALAVGIATTIVMIRQEKVTREGQRLQREQAEATAARTEAHQHHSSYVLTNVGNAEARNVRVSAHESLPLLGLDEAPQEVGPHEAISFLAARTFGTKDSTIRVTWTDPESGEDRTWKYPLPPGS